MPWHSNNPGQNSPASRHIGYILCRPNNPKPKFVRFGTNWPQYTEGKNEETELAALKTEAVSNNSLRATGLLSLCATGVLDKLIMERSGHLSTEGVQSHERTTVQQEKAVSSLLSSPSKLFVDAVKPIAMEPPQKWNLHLILLKCKCDQSWSLCQGSNRIQLLDQKCHQKWSLYLILAEHKCFRGQAWIRSWETERDVCLGRVHCHVQHALQLLRRVPIKGYLGFTFGCLTWFPLPFSFSILTGCYTCFTHFCYDFIQSWIFYAINGHHVDRFVALAWTLKQ